MDSYNNKPLEIGDIIKIQVTDLNSEAAGIGRINNLVVFIDGALPGETVEAEITEVKKNYLTAKILNVIQSSECRQNPVCPVFFKCGGCSLQHLDYDHQLIYKAKKVRDALERISGIKEKDIRINNIIGTDRNQNLKYRNKAQYFFEQPDDKILCGFFERKSHKIVNHADCFIVSEEINELKNTFVRFVNENKISIYSRFNPDGFLKSIVIRHSFSTNELMLIIIGNIDPGKDLKKQLENLTDYLIEKVPHLKSIYMEINPKSGNYSAGIEENRKRQRSSARQRSRAKLMRGTRFINEKIGDFKFQISPDSFFQTNSAQTETLYEKAVEFADLKGNETVVDLFCGTGTISLFMAKKAFKLTGVDIVRSAINDAAKNANLNNIRNAKFIYGDAFEIMKQYSQSHSQNLRQNRSQKRSNRQSRSQKCNIDVLVVDPPRNGLEKNLIGLISGIRVKKIIYVSCNPSTLARDIKLFYEKNYKVDLIQPIDMFPQTEHVETVVLMSEFDKSSGLESSYISDSDFI